ncbi:MAG: NADH-quinone oxidoreductase subunit NuoG [Gammaproteobacteria bacterium]|nr:NADH-quinone oxidoreductase subunit NuoG [Gammaproteobacteria bacterium]
MVSIEIDGQKIKANDGAMVIEAADAAGIYIPRFCYHKKLSVAANCRMCLIEVEKARKPLPACATPVTDGMKVATRSPNALMAQKGVMEFLLINHPLDCPICDQGGECELQDIAMGYGRDVGRFSENKRVVKDKNIGPLIATDMTRCIHCTRCVRFGVEISGIKELGATGRGEHMEIGTYVEASVHSELSGNVIDLCPVGALTSKPFRFSARAWEMYQRESIAGHDCVGSNIGVHVRNNRVMRVAPSDNEQVNETWISDRDRFAYQGLNHEERITRPMIKEAGEWKVVEWQTALTKAVEGLQKTLSANGPDELAFLASPNSTLEEHYLYQKLARGLDCHHIDHRLRQQDFSDDAHAPAYVGLAGSIEDLENIDAVLLVASNIHKEQPLIAHRLRKAAMKGARVVTLNSLDYELRFNRDVSLVNSPNGIVSDLAAIAKAMNASGVDSIASTIEVTEQHKQSADILKAAKNAQVIIGSSGLSHANAAALKAIAQAIANTCGAKFSCLSDGANSAGAAIAGCVPYQTIGAKKVGPGFNVAQIIEKQPKAMTLLNLEAEVDCIDAVGVLNALSNAEFVVALSSFCNKTLEDHADVILPIATYAETAGTFVNVEGRHQSFNGIVPALGESRPAWKVLRVMANMFNLDGFDYISVEEVLNEIENQIGNVNSQSALDLATVKLDNAVSGLSRIGDVPMYAIDAIVRRASALQATHDAVAAACYINEKTAAKQNLNADDRVSAKQKTGEVELSVSIDNRVADNCVYIPSGLAETSGLGAPGVEIEITKRS